MMNYEYFELMFKVIQNIQKCIEIYIYKLNFNVGNRYAIMCNNIGLTYYAFIFKSVKKFCEKKIKIIVLVIIKIT